MDTNPGGTGGYPGCPAPRGGPHENGRVLMGGADGAPVLTGHPSTTGTDPNPHPPFRDVVLPNAALRLLQALELEQTWETLTRPLHFPRIALAAPARGARRRGPPRPSNAGSTAWRLPWTHQGN